MKEEKKLLRKQIAQEKSRYDTEWRIAASNTLFSLIEKHQFFQSADTILLYHSLPDEVYTHDFIEKWYKKKKILLPVVCGDILKLKRYSGKENLTQGAFRIEEPEGDYFTSFYDIKFAVIPGVSFDKEGNRLGRGKGYYDKLLPLLLNSFNIGICYQFQTRIHIPSEPFDKKMNEVWTEDGCFFSPDTSLSI